MNLDKAKSIVRLVEGNIVGIMMDLVVDTEIGFVLEDKGRGGCRSGGG